MYYQLIDRQGRGQRYYVRLARPSDIGIIAPLRNTSKIAPITINDVQGELQVAPGDGANEPDRVQLIWSDGQVAYLVLGVRISEGEVLAFASNLRPVK